MQTQLSTSLLSNSSLPLTDSPNSGSRPQPPPPPAPARAASDDCSLYRGLVITAAQNWSPTRLHPLATSPPPPSQITPSSESGQHKTTRTCSLATQGCGSEPPTQLRGGESKRQEGLLHSCQRGQCATEHRSQWGWTSPNQFKNFSPKRTSRKNEGYRTIGQNGEKKKNKE